MKPFNVRTDAGRPDAGFTLIELMATVAIVAVLSAVALPAYQNYMRTARRADAKTALLDYAARQERYFSVNNVYALGSDPSVLGYGTTTYPLDIQSSGTVYYQISTPTATNGFQASAVPKGSQSSDTCGTFSLDGLGNQSATGSSSMAMTCW